MNSVNLIGRMTADPELSATATGKRAVRFCLAVRRNKDSADFINCVAYEGAADMIVRFVRKGQMIGISGALNVNTAEKNGEKRTYTNVIVNRLTFCDSPRSDSAEAPAEPASEFIPVDMDEDLPF